MVNLVLKSARFSTYVGSGEVPTATARAPEATREGRCVLVRDSRASRTLAQSVHPG
jgi:hypothetical protein